MGARLTFGLIAIAAMFVAAACGGGSSVTQPTKAPAAKPVKDPRAARA